MAGRLVILKAKGEDSWRAPRLVIDKRQTATFRKEDRMSEDETRRGEEDEVEVEAHAHGGHKGKAMTDEPKADEDSSDDFEAHLHGGGKGKA